MRQYRYLHLDVFTDHPFEGNQLAVFPQAQRLEAGVMQAIAREMAFSETTFILPPEADGDVRMRIFTPGEELPMAGHPTIGSTFALAREGVIEPGRETFTFELNIGPTPVALDWEGEQLSFAWMTQRPPTFGQPLDAAEDLARAVHADPASVAGTPVQEVSCGVPFVFLALASRKAVDQAEPDRSAVAAFFETHALRPQPVFLFTLEAGPDEATVYSRMFAPTLGIAEDPATGGASGPLGCYLLRHGLLDADRAHQFISLQGVKMGRPSRIHVSIDTDGGEIARVRVGGRAVMVGEGVLSVP
jgi:trans-2,3-dihydro-3-hydroxyanthranilate isomerase